MLSTIILSKDRPAQLDLVLNSLKQNAQHQGDYQICVIINYSDESFLDGYLKMARYHKDVLLYFDNNEFKPTLKNVVDNAREYLLFLTDDDIIYRPIEANVLNAACIKLYRDQRVFTMSLRLGINTFVQDQYNNTICIVPPEVQNSTDVIRLWNWRTQPMDCNFAYPFSVDGHVFRQNEFDRIISNLDYFNPNSLEGRAQHTLEKMPDLMGCFERSYVVNTPANRVQETCLNRAGEFFSYSPEELNQEFLKGRRLSLNKMDFSTVIGCHQEIKLEWEDAA